MKGREEEGEWGPESGKGGYTGEKREGGGGPGDGKKGVEGGGGGR